MLQWTKGAYVFLDQCFCFLCIFRSAIAGSIGSSTFNFLRNLHTDSGSVRTTFQSHRQCRRVPFFPHPRQPFLIFLMIEILTGVRWHVLFLDVFGSWRWFVNLVNLTMKWNTNAMLGDGCFPLCICTKHFNAFWKGNSPKYLWSRYDMTHVMAADRDSKNLVTAAHAMARMETGSVQPQSPGTLHIILVCHHSRWGSVYPSPEVQWS